MLLHLKKDIHEFASGHFSNFAILKSYVVFFLDMAISISMTFVALFVLDPISPIVVDKFLIIRVLLFCVVATGISFWLFRTYRRIIRHTTMRDLLFFSAACMVKVLLESALSFIPFRGIGFSTYPEIYTTAFILDFSFTFIAMVLVRVVLVTIYEGIVSDISQKGEKALIYGIGKRAYSVLQLLERSSKYQVGGFLNHDSKDKGLTILNYRVWAFETEKELEAIFIRTRCRYILFPSLKDLQKEKERLVNVCQRLGVKMLIAPTIDNVTENVGSLSLDIREINIEDLLGRDEIQINMLEVQRFFIGKTVMVTGAAGSIGSEICRQLAGVGVGKLVLFDNAETPMHELRLELEEKWGKDSPGGEKVKIYPIIGDVRYPDRLKMVFERHHPQIVFHAAAYKHVPLMEENPCEAILVNVIGSRNVADFCVRYGVSNMIMISTDKAVNPTNVMGATKRAAELYVQSLGRKIQAGEIEGTTKFTTTRFGNVLGSNGSVIPRFRRQIQKGGPLTVTSPDINRYFMSIPEATRLVLEAATMGKGCDIFVFDMGAPVKIIDLARKMIELAGYVPEQDIKIAITGLRPGEKNYEEVLANAENSLETSNRKIRIAKVRDADYEEVCKADDELRQLSIDVDIDGAVKTLKRLIPEFKSQNSVYSKFD